MWQSDEYGPEPGPKLQQLIRHSWLISTNRCELKDWFRFSLYGRAIFFLIFPVVLSRSGVAADFSPLLKFHMMVYRSIPSQDGHCNGQCNTKALFHFFAKKDCGNKFPSNHSSCTYLCRECKKVPFFSLYPANRPSVCKLFHVQLLSLCRGNHGPLFPSCSTPYRTKTLFALHSLGRFLLFCTSRSGRLFSARSIATDRVSIRLSCHRFFLNYLHNRNSSRIGKYTYSKPFPRLFPNSYIPSWC